MSGGSTQPAWRETLERFGLGEEDLAAWRASDLPDTEFEDWLTDRVARSPRGRRARAVYGAEEIHDFARRAILDALALGAEDHVLDIGCGGGLLLRDAIGIGSRASGVDHSVEMVELARQNAPEANVVLAEADRLPFPDASFTAASMSVVFFFFDRPLAVLEECRRVLRPAGRLAIYTTAPELRGTPAAPEPLAARAHFYNDEQLLELALAAGLQAASVRNERGGQLLVASKPA